MRFLNKNILVVGMGSGIGKATAKRLALEGACIIGMGRREEVLKATLAELSGEGHQIITGDAADETIWSSVSKLGKELGGYDGAVFCAGLHEIRPLSLLKAEHLMAAFQANVATAIYGTKALAKAASSEGAGIVWLSSVAALRGSAGFAAYAASKGALIAAAKVAAVELAKKKIRVNVVAAGVVDTAMSEGWRKQLSPEQQDEIASSHLLGIGQPEAVADAIAFLVSTDARWITGTTLIVDGGLSVR